MSDRKQDARAVDELRQEVARLDVQLVALLDKRARACRQIGELRRAGPAPSSLSLDSAAVEDALSKSAGDLPLPALKEILAQVNATCLALELPEPVAYVGGEGEAGHAAALARFGASATLLPADTPAEALEQIQRQRAAFAIVPLETREDGPVQATIEALTSSELKIVAAFESPSNLQLLSLGGSAPDATSRVSKVYLTARDHLRCTKMLERLRDAVTVVEVRTPLVACQLASEDPATAAVAMAGLAIQFGLEIAEKNVLDRGNERTRYAVVAPRPGARTGNDATLIAFSVADSPGALFDVLRQFAEREINMTKIQSRPVGEGGEGWMYTFFAEIVGHATDRNVVTALEEVKRHTKFFRVLGSYATA
jgi:chorismate mutase/prephenate dehydratase